MSLFDSYSPQTYQPPVLDEELLMGASYGSNVTVEAIIIQATKGGGLEVWAGYEDWRSDFNPSGGVDDFNQWAENLKAEAAAFGGAHVQGDPNTAAYKQARQAMEALYALAKIHQNDESIFLGPNGHTLSWGELLSSIQATHFIIGPHSDAAHDAYTTNTGTSSTIYIDQNRLTSYISTFGPDKGVNYAVYHELAHALHDGYTDRNDPNREVIANDYGFLLAGMNEAIYPTKSELTLVDNIPGNSL